MYVLTKVGIWNMKHFAKSWEKSLCDWKWRSLALLMSLLEDRKSQLLNAPQEGVFSYWYYLELLAHGDNKKQAAFNLLLLLF